jgi:hypothetical protein
MKPFLFFALLTTASLAAEQSRNYTNGKLLCAAYGSARAYSDTVIRSGERAYSLAIEIDKIVYLTTEVGKGAFASRHFKEKDWIIGDPVQIHLDENKRRIYMQNPKGKEIELSYRNRVRSDNWEGCRAMAEDVRNRR